MNVVIDTNIMFAGLSLTSPYFPLIEGIYTQTLTLLCGH